MNRVDDGLFYAVITAFVLGIGLFVGSLLHTSKREPSKIEHFDIACASPNGIAFQVTGAKSYDVRGNILEITSPSGDVLLYEVPPHVLCVVDPQTTEEVNGGP